VSALEALCMALGTVALAVLLAAVIAWACYLLGNDNAWGWAILSVVGVAIITLLTLSYTG
jgi:hypothetical protein